MHELNNTEAASIKQDLIAIVSYGKKDCESYIADMKPQASLYWKRVEEIRSSQHTGDAESIMTADEIDAQIFGEIRWCESWLAEVELIEPEIKKQLEQSARPRSQQTDPDIQLKEAEHQWKSYGEHDKTSEGGKIPEKEKILHSDI
ncbi:MAG: hypothetical protein Q9220_003639 [cf. Caloplaca sp. 1 TL-2023]